MLSYVCILEVPVSCSLCIRPEKWYLCPLNDFDFYIPKNGETYFFRQQVAKDSSFQIWHSCLVYFANWCTSFTLESAPLLMVWYLEKLGIFRQLQWAIWKRIWLNPQLTSKEMQHIFLILLQPKEVNDYKHTAQPKWTNKQKNLNFRHIINSQWSRKFNLKSGPPEKSST